MCPKNEGPEGSRLRAAALPLAFVGAAMSGAAFTLDQPVMGMAVLVVESFLLAWLIKGAGKDIESRGEVARHWMEQARTLAELATVDPLTSAGNARGFEAEFWRCLSRYHRRTELFSLAILDAGDAIRAGRHLSTEGVVEVAALIDAELRMEDTVYRLGPQRFVVLLAGANERGARRFADRVRTRLTGHAIKKGGGTAYVTLNAGVAEWKQGMQSPADLLAAAEADIERFELELRKDMDAFRSHAA